MDLLRFWTWKHFSCVAVYVSQTRLPQCFPLTPRGSSPWVLHCIRTSFPTHVPGSCTPQWTCSWTLHTESICFYIITSPQNPVILGLPWLRQHNPLISWKQGRIIQWDPSCQANCLIDNPAISVQAITLTDKPVLSSTLPSEYSDLVEAFSKSKASELPSFQWLRHWFIRCSTTHRLHISFVTTRVQRIKNYINEELSMGFIRPWTSPA